MENMTLIICSIVRNCEESLKKNILVIDELCDRVKDYHIVIYENDSADNTRAVLVQWAERRKNVHLILEDTGKPKNTIPGKSEVSVNPYFSAKRISKMVDLRNQYLEYIERKNLTADYVMVVDLDVTMISLKGIMHSLQVESNWDAITAYGYSLSPRMTNRYHDAYALVESGMEQIPQTEKSIKDSQYKWASLSKGDLLVKVFSAYGGLAIYKFKAIQNLRYQLLLNGDDRVEVRCEHFSLCKQMHDRGFSNIFINPKMTIKYQEVSMSLIYSRIRSIFGGD